MIGSLRSVRITRAQLGAVALVSALASALVITSALGRSSAQTAALAALSRQPTALRPAALRSAGPAGRVDAAAAAVPAPVPAAGPVASATPSPAPASPPTTGSGGGGATTATTLTTTTSAPATAPKHPIGHVFVIALSTTSFDAAWGQSSPAGYLNRTLKPAGTFLGGYATLGAAELPDYLALVGGQAPNPATEADCATYAEFPTGTRPQPNGQVPGTGCVYPNTVTTIADQVTAKGKLWRGYIADQGPASCVHPNSGAADATPPPGSGLQYDTRHNPFIYFHSLLDLGGCAANDGSLDQLASDLRAPRSTPAYSFIAPGSCQDAAATSCPGGAPAGLAGEDVFLRRWVPAIERSAAYRRDGAIVIVFALAGAIPGSGSTPTGALVLSPFAAHGKTIGAAYGPDSILRGIEELLGCQPLAGAKRAKSFVDDALPGS